MLHHVFDAYRNTIHNVQYHNYSKLTHMLKELLQVWHKKISYCRQLWTVDKGVTKPKCLFSLKNAVQYQSPIGKAKICINSLHGSLKKVLLVCSQQWKLETVCGQWIVTNWFQSMIEYYQRFAWVHSCSINCIFYHSY